ncbi:helix-turn-helix domain-containing protein [Flavobacterium sp. 28A]|uniref:helix-turn-helix domain-containing protein n=1 Tax=Flavobacterium sp. 28A TaxID=2735895 RepID=UPI002111BC64|nr:helix-turn-helix transcriptional regulator [Flavobacterium sp. 28A]
MFCLLALLCGCEVRDIRTAYTTNLLFYRTLRRAGFNEKIKVLRKSANMNQLELADKIHIHVTHLSKMENGHLLPSINIVQRLMKVFAVSADSLLNDSESGLVDIQNNELNQQILLINQLDEDEKNALIKIINSMLTKKRMKDLLDGKVNF